MAANVHSRIVFWAKIILPLIALGLLSTMFLFSRTPVGTSEIPFSELERIAEDQQITGPTFSAVSEDGITITIFAENAKPEQLDNEGRIEINSPLLTLSTTDGSSLTVRSGQGLVNSSQQTAELRNLARLETSNGYVMETTELVADLKSGVVQSLGPLEIIAPFGRMTAGSVEFLMSNEDGGQQMRFLNGVRMIYDPQTQQ